MLTDLGRRLLERPAHTVARSFLRLGLSPNIVSLLAPTISVLVVAPLLVMGSPGAALLILAIVLPLDAVDGTMARLSNTASNYGRVVDHMSDRVTDAAVLVGTSIYCARFVGVFALSLASSNAALWQLQSQTSVLLREAGIDIDLGPFQRTERLTVVAVALAFASGGLRTPFLVSMATLFFLSIASLVLRIVRAYRTRLRLRL